ncbi:Protein spinster 3 [Halocaridina rubra]|uniref:Protein spinster 3 n=1 Tax=Halocaridina rubra TaxID=373956 RepID=A0AAN8WKE6_HALRR
MLAVYSFAIPAGAGIGFMLGAIILIGVGGDMTEEERIDKEIWRWSLRVTPWLGFIAVILIVMLLEEPERGRSEGGHNLRITSMKKDIKYLLANKAFVLDTLGFSCVAFVLGALAWWSPLFISLGVKVQADTGNVPGDIVPIIFGAVSMAAGLMGVPLGSYIGQKLRVKYPKADPLVCGFGLAIALPILLATIFLAEHNTLASLILCFIGQLFQNLSWAIVIDIMLLYTSASQRK